MMLLLQSITYFACRTPAPVRSLPEGGPRRRPACVAMPPPPRRTCAQRRIRKRGRPVSQLLLPAVRDWEEKKIFTQGYDDEMMQQHRQQHQQHQHQHDPSSFGLTLDLSGTVGQHQRRQVFLVLVGVCWCGNNRVWQCNFAQTA